MSGYDEELHACSLQKSTKRFQQHC